MKTILLGIFTLVSLSVFAQRFSEKQWNQLSDKSKETLNTVTETSCGCYNENKHAAQHLQKNVMHYSKVKRTGKELTDLEKSNLDVAMKFADDYLKCIRNNGFNADEGDKLFEEIESLYDQEFDSDQSAKLKVNTLVYKLSKDCSSESASNVMMVIYFLMEKDK